MRKNIDLYTTFVNFCFFRLMRSLSTGSLVVRQAKGKYKVGQISLQLNQKIDRVPIKK